MRKMVINKTEMKRKRKEGCSSPLLDDSPKRTKVHAQRKFAQGSNVNSPVITPVKEIERQEIDVLPEPVELLPIKRPNTEDFLTFLCFRGTPILPPSLNFFNTASIVDNNGQVHEIKSESPKNGPIDTSVISKAGSGSADRPFIAFGVRKRADPIVISRQMDKKRRHALTLQALRRKYQEQKMAKIRAVTISKLSEKVTSKSSTVSKTETVTKKTSTLPKNKVTEVSSSTKKVKVVQQEVKTTLRSQIKPKMCLRSFRGRFVQKELQFRNVKKRPLPMKKLNKSEVSKKNVSEENAEEEISSEYDSEEENLSDSKSTEVVLPKIAKKSAPGPKKPSEMNFRVTRSNKFANTKITTRRQQIKQQLLSTPKTIVKPRTLRSHTQKLVKSPEIKSRLMQLKVQKEKQVKKEIVVKKFVQRLDLAKYVPVRKVIKVENVKKVSAKTEVVKKPQAKAEAVKKIITPVKSSKKPEPVKRLSERRTGQVCISKSPKKFKIVEVPNKEMPKFKMLRKPLVQKDLAVKKEIKKIPAPIVKKITNTKVEQVKKETVKKEIKEEDSEAKECESKNQRPSRKTKEAAAIYMELLSQKLVNESKIDDDNVSIDSFPELPNVKRTEQRENELKAKAKSNKSADREIDKKPIKSKELDKRKNEKKSESPEKETSKKTTNVVNQSSVAKKDEPKKDEPKKTPADKDKDDKKRGGSKEEKPKLAPVKTVEVVEKMTTRESANKKKYAKKTEIEQVSSESEISVKQQKVRKSEEKTVETNKRQTRNSAQNVKHQEETEDSDESFRVDIKIPRKKQVTRSKVTKKYEGSDLEDNEKAATPPIELKKSSRTKPTSYLECSSSESDISTTSEVKPASTKPKKFTKTKNLQKKENFSDSDEEPLSKLTQKSSETKETKKDSETAKPEEKDVLKPKRECAKRPQNYLPMFSSSDDESLLQGFQTKTEPKTDVTKPVQEICTHAPPALELKDISRRFGKGKVNMSNEQIEKWLNDAAMAGNCVRNENDEMLKFGEKIPTETSFSVANQIDTEKLKTLLVQNTPEKTEMKKDLDELSPKTSSDDCKLLKPTQLLDKKLIFRNKDKIIASPNAKAFSANNESSVYAFGEDDDLMKAPFRRPTRRPSSTATSRSEDELSKYEDITKLGGQFRKPSVKQEINKIAKDEGDDETKIKTSPVQKNPITAMVPPAYVVQKCNKIAKPTKSLGSETSEEFKYKVPSSPSASSSSSAKLYKKQNNNKPKIKLTPEVNPVNLTEFPTGNVAQLVEAPIFHPNEKEFQDPIEYIEKIRSMAEQFGICRIVPPATFKPECKVTDDMRFTAYNQYVHKMLHRWGPNFKELMAIKKYLSTQNISLTHPPWIGGMEIDLPRLYQTVQSLGGLKEVIEKKKWSRVSDAMKIPKSAQDRVTKLDDIYCKYLLPYDTLSPDEREKLFDEVETEWAKRQSKTQQEKSAETLETPEDDSSSESDDEIDECIVKGRSMALNAFYRIARNTMSMWFKTPEPSAEEVEQEFWRHVQLKQNHICVHSGSIDSGNWGYGFAVSKNSPFARHAWNLKVLTNNSGSVLRSMGPVMGVTVPTLHVGMVFSACCWYRDPHGLPWVEYLHTGGRKIWYGIPDATGDRFHAAMKKIVPNYCLEKQLWLPSDTVMVPPNLLVENGVSLSRTVQEPGQFIVVFPKVFTSSLSTGYVVSESVYFAPPKWLQNAKGLFDELRNSCEPSMFSFERLLLCIVNDSRTSVDVLSQIIPAVQELCDKERVAREKIRQVGVTKVEKLPLPDAKKRKKQDDEEEYECEVCRMNLFVSMVTESENDGVYCLDHAFEEINKKTIESKNCKLSYTYDDKELEGLVEKISMAITNKMQKKIPNKYAGMPTLLTK